MAQSMPVGWTPPARTTTGERRGRKPAARWQTWADGHWWALRPGADLPAECTLTRAYRSAWVWANYHGLRCEGRRDETAGVLYLRFTAGDPKDAPK